MDYKIVQREAFKVIGKVIKLSTKNEGHHMAIAEFWSKCHTDGTINKMDAINNTQNLLGISMEFSPTEEQFSYMIAKEYTYHSDENGFETRVIPASEWAVYTAVGPMPQAIVNVLSSICRESFAEAGFEQVNGPMLEVYLPGNPASENYKCEVWVPIVKK